MAHYQLGGDAADCLELARNAADLQANLLEAQEAIAVIRCLAGDRVAAGEALNEVLRGRAVAYPYFWVTTAISEANLLATRVPAELDEAVTRTLACIHSRRNDQAAAGIDQLLQAQPDCADFVRLRGMLQGRLERQTEAFDDLTQALRLEEKGASGNAATETGDDPDPADPFFDTLVGELRSNTMEQFEQLFRIAVDRIGMHGGYVETAFTTKLSQGPETDTSPIYFPEEALETTLNDLKLTVAYCARDGKTELRSQHDWQRIIASYIEKVFVLASLTLHDADWEMRVEAPCAAIRIDEHSVNAVLRMTYLVRRRLSATDKEMERLLKRGRSWQAVILNCEASIPFRLGEMYEVVQSLSAQVQQHRQIDPLRLPAEKYLVELRSSQAGVTNYQLTVKQADDGDGHPYTLTVRDGDDGRLYILHDEQPTEEASGIRNLLFAEQAPALAKQTVRSGWPQLVPIEEFAQDKLDREGPLRDVLTLSTGMEEKIEQKTESSYERLAMLALCVQLDGSDPVSLPLDKQVVGAGGPPFTKSEFGLDLLDLVEAVMLCESVLNVSIPDSQFNESQPPTIQQLAAILAQADQGAEQ